MLAVLLTSLLHAAPPAITVAPLQGKATEACTRAIREIAAAHAPIEPWHTHEKRPPATWKALSRWLEDRRNELLADIVVVGLVDGTSIVLEAYDPESKKLVGLRRVGIGKRCKLGKGSRAVLDRFFAELVAHASGGELPTSIPLMGDAGEHREETPPDEEAAREDLAAEHARGADLLGGHPQPKVEPQPRATEAPKKVAAPPRAPPQRTIAAELGFALVRRAFQYEGALTSNLRAFDADAMPVPSLSLEASPFAGLGPARLAPIFVAASFRRAVGVRASRPDGGPDHDVSYFETGVHGGYRFTALGLALSPRAGYHRTQLTLEATQDGQLELDLPGVAYACLELGLDVEVPIRESITAFGGASYLVVLSGGEIFERTFFANGSALGVDLVAGVRLALGAGISAVLGAGYRRFALTLGAGERNRRVAASAADSMFMIDTGLRFEL